MDAVPPITIVAIGRNEGQRLVRCLESIRQADYPADRVEVIYVDSRSTDGSPEQAARCGARVVVLETDRPTAAAGRNAGLAEARHDLVQFMDGDTELHPGWLRKAVAVFDDPAVACVFGRVTERHPEASIYNFWAHHDWHVQPGPAEACGGIAMFRRDVLRQVGGYDPDLTAGEERDLCYRITRDTGARLQCLADEMVSHDIDMLRFGQYWNRCRRVGHAYAEISQRYPDLRSYRQKCRRNALHGGLLIAAVLASVLLRSAWPAGVWLLLVMLLTVRQAARMRPRLESFPSALLYAGHHFVSKFPTLLGQIEYALRRRTGRQRRATTYRDTGPADERGTAPRDQGS